MSINVITPPATLALLLADARVAARVNGTDLDAEITIKIQDLTAFAEHQTGRVFINRTYEITLDRFPDAIEMTASPLSSVVSIKYLDPVGVEQTLSLADVIVDAKSQPGYIVPGVGLAWPATQSRINAVTVRVICGYGPDHTTTPAPVKAFVMARLREVYAPAGTPESPYLIRGLDSLIIY